MIDFSSLSNDSISKMHRGAREAYRNDKDLNFLGWTKDAQGFVAPFDPQKPNPLNYFGTEEYRDWPLAIEAMEAELKKRELPFSPIREGK